MLLIIVIGLAQGLMTLIENPAAEPVILGFFGMSLLIVGSSVRRRALLVSSAGKSRLRIGAGARIVRANTTGEST